MKFYYYDHYYIIISKFQTTLRRWLRGLFFLFRGRWFPFCLYNKISQMSKNNPFVRWPDHQENPHIRESRMLAPVRPGMQAAGLQCLLRSLLPTRKPAHFPVRRCPGNLVTLVRMSLTARDSSPSLRDPANRTDANRPCRPVRIPRACRTKSL